MCIRDRLNPIQYGADIVIHSLTTVSYTHLDVYKRQAELRPEFDRMMKQQIANAEAKKYNNWQNVAQYYEALKLWWDNNTTVSYTHLDVYKRQQLFYA